MVTDMKKMTLNFFPTINLGGKQEENKWTNLDSMRKKRSCI